MKKYFYIGKKEALNNQSLFYKQSDSKIENFKEVINENAVEFYGEELPYYVTIEGDTARVATDVELVDRGIIQLEQGQFISDNQIRHTSEFAVPFGMIKPVFNYETLEYEESANPDEVLEFFKNEKLRNARDILVYKEAGLIHLKEYQNLLLESERLNQIYINAGHTLALEIDSALSK